MPRSSRQRGRTRILSLSVPASPQRTVTGQRPGGVLVPTRQRQVIMPPFFGPSPLAFDTTVSYLTSTVQSDLGETLTVSEATLPARTGDVSETFRTARTTGHGLVVFGIGCVAMLFETSAKLKALGPGPTA